MINLHIIVVSCTIKESYYGSLQYRTARLLLGLFNNSNSVYHSGHYMGHMAVLIGDDEHGWYFISKEGRDKSDNAPRYSNEITGGPSYTYWKWFPSKADFDNKRNQFEKTK